MRFLAFHKLYTSVGSSDAGLTEKAIFSSRRAIARRAQYQNQNQTLSLKELAGGAIAPPRFSFDSTQKRETGTDHAQSWHAPSRPPVQEKFKSQASHDEISMSYDRNKFCNFPYPKNCHFRKKIENFISRPYQRILNSGFRLRSSHDLNQPLDRKKSFKKISKIFRKFSSIFTIFHNFSHFFTIFHQFSPIFHRLFQFSAQI